jgi:N-acetylneuraminic acid mutarotase
MMSRMVKPVVILFVLLSLTALFSVTINPCNASEDSWITRAFMNEARAGLGEATVNGKIYAIGGSNQYHSGVVGTNEEYDPSTNKWNYKSPMPTPRTSFGIAVYQNKIYCIGGEINNSLAVQTNEVYDPSSDTWETKTPMPTARYGLTANVAKNKIYLISGLILPYLHSPIPLSNVNEVYDPLTDSWTTKTPIPSGFYGYSSAVVDEKIYVMGGAGIQNSNLNQIYDTRTDNWRLGAPLPAQSYYASAGATSGIMAAKKIYVLGGTGGGISYSNQIYDPQNDSWSLGTRIPTDRVYLAVAVLNDTVFAIGGDVNSGVLSYINASPINEQYKPSGYGIVNESSSTHSPSPSPMPTSILTPSPSQTIEPSPSIPEFPQWIILPWAMIMVFVAVSVSKRKTRKF